MSTEYKPRTGPGRTHFKCSCGYETDAETDHRLHLFIEDGEGSVDDWLNLYRKPKPQDEPPEELIKKAIPCLRTLPTNPHPT